MNRILFLKSPLALSRILCQCGLDVSAMDFDGWTPLHAAAHWSQGEACHILAEQLCNMEARSNAVRPKIIIQTLLRHIPVIEEQHYSCCALLNGTYSVTLT